MSTLRTASPRFAPFALLLTLLACDERSPSAPLPGAAARELRVLGGDGQQAVAGAALPDELVLAAVDAAGRPLPGIVIRLVVVAGGGQVAPQAATSDGQGLARGRWTLGTVAADSQVVEARVDGVPPRRLRAIARPDAPAALVVTGGGAAGQVGAPLPDSLAVTVRDRLGNPVEGVPVAWDVAAGGGSVSPSRSPTRADGTAKTQWTLGPRADTAQVAVVRAGSLDPVTLTANAATRGAALQLARRGGDGQRGPAGGVLAESLSVVLRMPDGRPVPGAIVTWSAWGGGGTVMPAVSRTGADG
ncbi:MAG TPA: Ig-like domain-containing protein, partial [Longimicrobium sp.]